MMDYPTCNHVRTTLKAIYGFTEPINFVHYWFYSLS